MTTLMQRFIPESREYLESAASGLLRLERDPTDQGLVNEVFRAVHTLKGASGLFELPGLTRLLHAAEDLLGAARENQLTLDSAIVDLLLDALDRVGHWVDELERSGGLPMDAEGVSAELSRKLRALLPECEGSAEAVSAVSQILPPGWLDNFTETEIQSAIAILGEGGPSLLAIDYLPNDDCFYRGEDPVNLLLQLDPVVAVKLAWHNHPVPLAELDPFRCQLRLRALTTMTKEAAEGLFRYVIDQVTLYPVPADALRPPVAADPRTDIEPASAPLAAIRATSAPLANSGMAGRLLAGQRRIAAMPGDPETLRRRSVALVATLTNLMHSLDWSALEFDLDGAGLAAAGGTPAPLLALIDLLQARLPVTADQSPLAMTADKDIGGLVATGIELRKSSRMLKVDQAKVDSLMTLIAELVVSKNSLPFLAKRAEDVYGSREMGREIKDQYAVIDRLAQEMQRAILDVRMLPVTEVFERFPRLVRDLSRKLGKQIELRMQGEDTAADKNIIEALGDPLIHLVRNAIDHGVEMPAQRLAAGKPECATILLAAFQDGDQVVIEVSDDGKGIDPAVIRAKAVEKGLIDAARAQSLSDQDAANLIFLPGFSTASEVSDLSGRGVGMDVVRTAIDKINGQVTLTSRQGEGTLIRLSLPLSMAVTRVMMVEIDGELFGVPMDGVLATVRIAATQIHHIKNAETFVLRDSIVPLVRLRALLDLPMQGEQAAEEAVLVARVGAHTVGLVVDRFREGMDVILKPMDGLLAGLKGYAGSAMLGDGRVLLVLNLKELL